MKLPLGAPRGRGWERSGHELANERRRELQKLREVEAQIDAERQERTVQEERARVAEQRAARAEDELEGMKRSMGEMARLIVAVHATITRESAPTSLLDSLLASAPEGPAPPDVDIPGNAFDWFADDDE